ncbi:MAG: hypothetical protein ACI4UL_08585 [Muribaculaceae bacterium]
MNSHRISKLLIVCCIAACSLVANAVTLTTRYAEFKLDKKGFITCIADRSTGTNYVPDGTPSPLMKLYTGGENYVNPVKLQAKGSDWQLHFANGSVARLKCEVKDDYIFLQILDLSKREGVEAVTWGPYATTLSKYIGETVGVVRDGKFAFGVQPLKIVTTEGVPHLGDDAFGGFYVLPTPEEKVDPEYKDRIGEKVEDIDVNRRGDLPEGVRQIRGNAAVVRPYGSDVQFFARDWRKARTVDLYGRRQHIVAIDQDFLGAAIAIFASPDASALDVIGNIEVAEGLPHPVINGEWVKKNKAINPAYMLYEGASLDNALNYADSCQFNLVHIGDVFKSWGHFDLHTRRFPNGAADIKRFTDKARSRGIEIGVHTLTMFTSTSDPYVTPVANDSLCISGSSTIVKAISDSDTEIEVDSPEFFTYLGETHSAKIGGEIISYRAISKEAPYRLLDCTRGQFGTTPKAHAAGAKIDKLVNNCYSGFYPDIHLQQVMARRLAQVCNETGIGLMDFDGYYGGSPTGHGCLGSAMFAKTWYDSLNKSMINCGSSVFNYYWHIYSFMNWGEPWYDDLRQSQVLYRLENQRYFERNLMRGMLGWFKLEQTYRPEDIEWIQARSAAFDAGYLLRVDESVEKNGFKSQLFEAIRQWQKVRKGGYFTAEQREAMKNPKNEFHLRALDDNRWLLQNVTLKGGNRHKYRMVQTGEPLLSRYTFNNPYDDQPIQFYAYVEAGEDANATISNVVLQVEGAAAVEVPMELKAGDRIYSDGKNIYVCNATWQQKAVIPQPKTALWSSGNNNLTIACEFSNSQAPAIRFEFKALGGDQIVTAK